ncbi:MAG: CvpA family protein [Pseudomonadales bacterium]|jgi:membrane protein required for colicin V production|nr:CvpA family protein [Pseudomonadales bacterium]
MTLAALDWILLALAAVSVLLGAVRGLVREAVSLAVWIGAFLVAASFATLLEARLEEVVSAPGVRFPLAFAILFLTTLVVGSLAGRMLALVVSATGLTGLDRMLGGLFGAARGGVLLVVIAGVLAPLFVDADWWQASRLVPHLLAAQDETFAALRAVLGTVMDQGGA